jgi:hypothetical protein
VIPIDSDGPVAPPRHNGELVFDASWQARAFGMAVALLDHHGLGWEAFRSHLIEAIAAQPEAEYYAQFVDALAALAAELAGDDPPGQSKSTVAVTGFKDVLR